MLIKITNFCSMGCSHCMENSTVAGEHMTWETFEKALDLTERLERLAWDALAPKRVLLSGGECTEHPEFVRMLEEVVIRGWEPTVITNGSWLANEEMKKAILRPEWETLYVQVTNDPRFYPKALPAKVMDPRIGYYHDLSKLLPLGRAARRKAADIEAQKYPSSFNLRSLTRTHRSIEMAIAQMRLRAVMGFSGHCSPSISSDGQIVAGESNECFSIGTVDSTGPELTKALINMTCNKCGLVPNLSLEQKRAIGESSLYAASE